MLERLRFAPWLAALLRCQPCNAALLVFAVHHHYVTRSTGNQPREYQP